MKQQLLTLLDSQDNQHYYRYLLIDPLTSVSEMDFIDLNNIKDQLDDEAITTVIRSDLAYDLASCPKLVTIGKPNLPLEKRLLHFSVVEAQSEILQKKRYICGWMVSQYPPEVVAEQITHIGRFLTKYMGTHFVPFYEPFRMQLLHQGNAVCPEFLADVLNCFQHYSYPTINKTVNTIHHLGYKPENFTLFLSEEAKFYQQHSNILFDIYLSQVNILTKTEKEIDNISLMEIAESYHKACSYGLNALSDRKIFTLMSMTYGNLLSNTKIKQAIDAAKFDEGSLTERFKAIERPHFLSIKQAER